MPKKCMYCHFYYLEIYVILVLGILEIKLHEGLENMFFYNLTGFGLQIKHFRTQQHLTHSQVAKQIGINLDTLRRIENGLVVSKQ